VLKGAQLIAELGVVRNSIGSDAFVSDEIVTSHAGCRVRIGNTDAEGRLVLADLLSHLRLDAAKKDAAHLFSVATLTGHAGRAVGPYNIALDNGPARALGTAESLMAAGDLLRRSVRGLAPAPRGLRLRAAEAARPTTCCRATTRPSSATARGHQFPMAFLCLASGLAQARQRQRRAAAVHARRHRRQRLRRRRLAARTADGPAAGGDARPRCARSLPNG
jgi:leucyl aminopeptidase